MRAVNWNKKEDDFSLVFWKQNLSQFWTEEEIVVSGDKNTWNTLTKVEQNTYMKVLGGLTLLDTKQGGEGMPLLTIHTDNLQAKSVLAFMGAMEEVHAKSYSHIFTTLANEQEIDNLFKWVDEHPILTKKSELISQYYLRLLQKDVRPEELYMAMVASVFLESYLFYSGFYYPLFLAGQGKMTASGEIINLILRDESIHGVFVGLLAQQLYEKFDYKTKVLLKEKMVKLLVELYEIEDVYTHDVYYELGIAEDVLKFVRYNANKALQNLGFESYFPEEEVNPIVLNGLNTSTKNHDFFSVKGNGYVVATNIEELKDEDFKFDF